MLLQQVDSSAVAPINAKVRERKQVALLLTLSLLGSKRFRLPVERVDLERGAAHQGSNGVIDATRAHEIAAALPASKRRRVHGVVKTNDVFERWRLTSHSLTRRADGGWGASQVFS